MTCDSHKKSLAITQTLHQQETWLHSAGATLKLSKTKHSQRQEQYEIIPENQLFFLNFQLKVSIEQQKAIFMLNLNF
jgi:hypothetical protein